MKKILLADVISNQNFIFSDNCIIYANFYYRVGYGEACYLSSKNRNFPEIILPIEVGKIIEKKDETFGAMTGIFAYADYTSEVYGILHKEKNNVLYFSKIYSIKLYDEINSQNFEINLNFSI